MAHPDWPSLLSLAAHELRTPATVVSGYIKMLLQGHGGDLSEVQRQALTSADQSCTRLVELMAEMSDLARFERGALELSRDRVTVVDLLGALARDYVPPAGYGGQCVVTPVAAGLAVTVDRARATRALAALTTLVIREATPPATVAVSARRVGHEVMLLVSDGAIVPELDGAGSLQPMDELKGGLGLSIPLAVHVFGAAGGRVGVPVLASQVPSVAVVLPLTDSR
jgi:signal transduction histidine kinase